MFKIDSGIPMRYQNQSDSETAKFKSEFSEAAKLLKAGESFFVPAIDMKARTLVYAAAQHVKLKYNIKLASRKVTGGIRVFFVSRGN